MDKVIALEKIRQDVVKEKKCSILKLKDKVRTPKKRNRGLLDSEAEYEGEGWLKKNIKFLKEENLEPSIERDRIRNESKIVRLLRNMWFGEENNRSADEIDEEIKFNNSKIDDYTEGLAYCRNTIESNERVIGEKKKIIFLLRSGDWREHWLDWVDEIKLRHRIEDMFT